MYELFVVYAFLCSNYAWAQYCFEVKNQTQMTWLRSSCHLPLVRHRPSAQQQGLAQSRSCSISLLEDWGMGGRWRTLTLGGAGGRTRGLELWYPFVLWSTGSLVLTHLSFLPHQSGNAWALASLRRWILSFDFGPSSSEITSTKRCMRSSSSWLWRMPKKATGECVGG